MPPAVEVADAGPSAAAPSVAEDEKHTHDSGEEPRRRPRTMTSTDEIDSTITRPGSVKINFKGAFIVDPDTATPAAGNGTGNGNGNGRSSSPSHHETSDIRLPNHTAVVSHIAIDVSWIPLLFGPSPTELPY